MTASGRRNSTRNRAIAFAMGASCVAAAASAHATNPAGGAYASRAATIVSLGCQTGCAGLDAADVGSVLRLRGRDMREVDAVVFLGDSGAADETIDGRGEAPTVYYAGGAAPTLRLLVEGGSPVSLRVTLVRVSDGAVVRRWTPEPVAAAAGVVLAIAWDGRIGSRAPARAGRYQFQVWSGSGPATTLTGETATTTATAASTAMSAGSPLPDAADTFELRPYAFPVDGEHRFGDGAGRFGAGRGGGVHQGQDVFAECGTPVVAARGGVVEHKEYDARGGNYVVIDGDGTGQDMTYMHLREAALVDEGERVGTGQPIGSVGDSGHADGCHLHFELWTAPGWFSGGEPIDPLPALRSWDEPTG